MKDKMKEPEMVLSDINVLSLNMDIISKCRQDIKEEWQVQEGFAQKAPTPMIATGVEISFR